MTHKDAVRGILICGVMLGVLASAAFGFRQVMGEEPGGRCSQSFDCKIGVS
jgi:hypothetical protein